MQRCYLLGHRSDLLCYNTFEKLSQSQQLSIRSKVIRVCLNQASLLQYCHGGVIVASLKVTAWDNAGE